MSTGIAALRRQIASAGDLQSVVRTMKALAASSIGQYEQAVEALGDYYRAVELGLAVCIRDGGAVDLPSEQRAGAVGALVFGSDQGMVGRFNDIVAEHAIAMLAGHAGKARVWAVGERVGERLEDAGLPIQGLFAVPVSANAITPLVRQFLVDYEQLRERGAIAELHLVYNRPSAGAVYAPADLRLLPLDEAWRRRLAEVRWPSARLPEVVGDRATTLSAFIREYLFVSLFRAAAESLASENASRLAAMQRADRNIDALLEDLNARFHRLRQSDIDEELADVTSGYEALTR